MGNMTVGGAGARSAASRQHNKHGGRRHRKGGDKQDGGLDRQLLRDLANESDDGKITIRSLPVLLIVIATFIFGIVLYLCIDVLPSRGDAQLRWWQVVICGFLTVIGGGIVLSMRVETVIMDKVNRKWTYKNQGPLACCGLSSHNEVRQYQWAQLMYVVTETCTPKRSVKSDQPTKRWRVRLDFFQENKEKKKISNSFAFFESPNQMQTFQRANLMRTFMDVNFKIEKSLLVPDEDDDEEAALAGSDSMLHDVVGDGEVEEGSDYLMPARAASSMTANLGSGIKSIKDKEYGASEMVEGGNRV